MKNTLNVFLSSILTVSTIACTHSDKSQDPTEESIVVREGTVHDSDSDPQTLPKNAEQENDADSIERDREIAKEARPLVDNVSIIFEGTSSKLPKSSDALLFEVANQMKLDKKLQVRLEAYSPKDGKNEQNQKMAADSLANVKKKLLKLGVAEKRIRTSKFSRDMIDEDRKVEVVYE